VRKGKTSFKLSSLSGIEGGIWEIYDNNSQGSIVLEGEVHHDGGLWFRGKEKIRDAWEALSEVWLKLGL